MKIIVSVCSARPNFVKLAAVHHALAARSDEFKHVIVHTGQHYDPLLSDVFFEQLHIPQPGENLGVNGGTREEVINATHRAMLPVLEKIRPDIVLVYGDVNGAVGAARAAKELGMKIGHVEAGLRSFDMSMPEELNRIEIDGLSDILFCSEQSGVDHIKEEGVNGEVHLVGNTMIDTLMRMKPVIDMTPLPPALPSAFVVATLHRPSNVDDPFMLKRNIDVLSQITSSIPIVLPIHHRLKAALEQHNLLGMLSEHVYMLPPLGYLPFLRLLMDASFILTDSGGIQEETTFLRKRCFTLRKNTERPSTIDAGSNILIDIDKEEDRQKLLDFAKNPVPPHVHVPELWDGKAGERIVKILLENL